MVYLGDSYQLEKWFNHLVKERISPEIEINLVKDFSIHWVLSHPKYEKKIRIFLNNKLYKIGYQKDLEFALIKIKNNFFRSEFEILPAPGSKKVNGNLLNNDDEFFTINYDIFGLAFWMLNRCEEINPDKRLLDKHGRFKSVYSHSIINDYHLRPIVDEWFLFLSEVIKFNFPKLKIKKTIFKIFPTIDIDNPRKYSLLFKKRILLNYFRSFFQDISFSNLRYLFSFIKNNNNNDPYDNFDWILKENKNFGLKADFFFMVNHFNWRYDTGYDIENSQIKDLIKKIYLYGNSIYLHPSYNTINKHSSLLFQIKKLKSLCKNLSIFQQKWSARMHYLRFIFPQTAYQYIEAEIKYDSSLYFTDAPGFRCGTCKEYNFFDPINNKMLDLIERPLIYMDTSYLPTNGENKEDLSECIEKINYLKSQCRKVGGNFTFLWHNCQLQDSYKKDLYINTIEN